MPRPLRLMLVFSSAFVFLSTLGLSKSSPVLHPVFACQGVAGYCYSNGDCCSPYVCSLNHCVDPSDHVPAPTIRRPRLVKPTWDPVMRFLVGCKVRRPEFDPLRPYPANACDPLIPRKLPEAPLDIPNKLYLTFQCGRSADPRGTEPADDVVNFCGFPQIEVLPPSSQWGLIPLTKEDNSRSVNYKCSDEPTDYEICFVKRVDVTVALNFRDSQFPILGNTQNFLSDPAKVNQYLSSYLEGTIQQAEQKEIDPEDPLDMARVVNYSGPVKKLLSHDSQTTIRKTLINNLKYGDYHNYIVVKPATRMQYWANRGFPPYDKDHVNIPLSTLEDVTGEMTVGLFPTAQPRSPLIDGTIFSIGPLTVNGGSDSRLYFPHLKETNVLSQLLASTFRPHPYGTPDDNPPLTDPNPISTNNGAFLGQSVGEHQGFPPVPGAARDVPVQTQLINGQIVRNTEMREGAIAPTPLYSAPVQCDVKPVRTNPGDDLVGSVVYTTLTYKQMFRYTPSLAIDCPCASSNATTGCISYPDNCNAMEGSSCDGKVCCYGSCPAKECYKTNDPAYAGLCDYYDPALCTNASCASPCCVWSEPQCPTWPTVNLKTMSYISVFTKVPFVDRLYENLVSGPQSVLRRFLPGQTDYGPTPSPAFRVGQLTPTNAIVGATSANYSIANMNVQNPSVNSGTLYFPRIGGLYDHILGAGAKFSDRNLQCFFWPQGACKTTLACNDFEDLLTESGDGSCGICNSPLSPLARRILAQAGATFNVPAANIYAAMLHEGGDWDVYNDFSSDEDIRRWSVSEACGGEPMPKCDNDNPVTQPPFGFIKTWFYLGENDYSVWNAITEFLPERSTKEQISRCNFLDAAFAAAKLLSLSSARTDTTQCIPTRTCGGYTFSDNIRPKSCSEWTDTKVAQSQVYYGGQCYDLKLCDQVPYTTGDVVDWYNQYKCN